MDDGYQRCGMFMTIGTLLLGLWSFFALWFCLALCRAASPDLAKREEARPVSLPGLWGSRLEKFIL